MTRMQVYIVIHWMLVYSPDESCKSGKMWDSAAGLRSSYRLEFHL